jgi:hydroxyacylglutathione hydrolase
VRLGRVTVLPAADDGRYPNGHSLLVRGTSETLLIDPSLSVAASDALPSGIDRVLLSHCHEDHMAGLWRLPMLPVHVHEDDRIGLHSLDGLMTVYGLPSSIEPAWRVEVLDRFHYRPRPDAIAFRDGDRFDLGQTTLRIIHLPGHIRGHCGVLLEPDDVLFLADIDLTGFGPYYGDAWSSLDEFERSIDRCRAIDARWYVTFHHKGVVEGRAAFLELLDAYQAVIGRRERALLAFLTEPRTLEDIVAHRFVYRPHVALPFVEGVERRSAELHLARLIARGEVREVEPGRYLARHP